MLGEFCTGWAAELGGWASFVSLRARRGLHRAFLAPIGAPPSGAPPIDPLSCAAATRGPGGHAQPAGGNRIPDPSVMRSSPHANRPPTHHAGAGGIAKNVWGVSKRQRHVER